MRNLLKMTLFSAALAATSLRAADYQLGVQGGALGAGTESTIGYGGFFLANPYGIAALKVDATFADFDGQGYFATNPAVYVFLTDFEEVKLAVGGGAGFHKFEKLDAKFGLNLGAFGEFAIADQLRLGLEARYHWLMGEASDNVWSTFLTLAYAFETGGW